MKRSIALIMFVFSTFIIPACYTGDGAPDWESYSDSEESSGDDDESLAENGESEENDIPEGENQTGTTDQDDVFPDEEETVSDDDSGSDQSDEVTDDHIGNDENSVDSDQESVEEETGFPVEKAEFVSSNGSFQFMVNGKPLLIKGAGGSSHMEIIRPLGGNSVRSWGITEDFLNKAAALKLTVCAGIWNPDDTVKAVNAFKNHPAVLMWAIGNEMELRTGDTITLWKKVNTIAQEIKKIDPNHPVITVIAELGGNKIEELMQHAPALDGLGVNTYGGASSVAKRLKEKGWKKPFFVTEFGPVGHWEVPKNSWGVPIEQSSTEKAVNYLSSYKAFLDQNKEQFLGSYAFVWGNKQEKTHTWYGMFLPEDLGASRLGPVDAISFAWKGEWPENRVPEIGKEGIVCALKQGGNQQVEFSPGNEIVCTVSSSDPENDKITVAWDLRLDVTDNTATGGAHEDDSKPIAGSVLSSDGNSVRIKMPAVKDEYRVHVYLYDSEGGAATANLPVRVK